MCTATQLTDLINEVVSAFEDVYGKEIEAIYLYGSYARGDFDDESDIDFAAIVHGDRASLQKSLRNVWDHSSEIGMNYNIVISPTVIPFDEFEIYQEKLPYYNNILKEGRQVG